MRNDAKNFPMTTAQPLPPSPSFCSNATLFAATRSDLRTVIFPSKHPQKTHFAAIAAHFEIAATSHFYV
ncbi:MAG: hypothetical protein H6672_10685 [Anaerolineaceae bacterium]|nr:hypothetical protein [Anaerolineaceae bacterium]